MCSVAIFGAGGLGRMVRDILERAGLAPACYLDSDTCRHGSELEGLPVLGGLEAIPRLRQRGIRQVIVAIGHNATRVAIAAECRSRGLRLASAVHPLSNTSASADLADHLIIGARATICVHARVRSHAIISPGAIVEHDNEIGTGVMLEPAVRLAGGVRVDELATVGIGACIIPGRRIGRAAIVEPGAVVIRDVPPGAIVSGVPARTRTQRLTESPVSILSETVAVGYVPEEGTGCGHDPSRPRSNGPGPRRPSRAQTAG